MTLKDITIAVVFVLVSSLPVNATGESRIPQVDLNLHGDVMASTLSDAERRASLIARVHVNSRTSVNLQPVPGPSWKPTLGEGQGASCGYLYHATVVDSIKGENKSFDFFSSVDADFTGYDHDYVVIVFARDENTKLLNLQDTKYTIPETEGRTVNCLLSQKYYVATNMQTMFSIVANTTASPVEERLLPPNRYAPGSCWLFRKAIVSWSSLRMLLIAFLKKDSFSSC